MATIVHFEIPFDNIERAIKFYDDLFGWNTEKMLSPIEYWTFRTGNRSGEQVIGGGIMKRQQPQQAITNYIGVYSSTSSQSANIQKGRKALRETKGPKD